MARAKVGKRSFRNRAKPPRGMRQVPCDSCRKSTYFTPVFPPTTSGTAPYLVTAQSDPLPSGFAVLVFGLESMTFTGSSPLPPGHSPLLSATF
jgi:hypothetical protein